MIEPILEVIWGVFLASVILFFWMGHYIAYWFRFLRHMPSDQPQAGNVKRVFFIGVSLIILLGIGTVLLMNLPVSDRFSDLSQRGIMLLYFFNIVFPVYLNTVILRCLRTVYQEVQLALGINILRIVLPWIAIIPVACSLSMSPYAHPDIPFFAILFSCIQFLLTTVWLLYHASWQLMGSSLTASVWTRQKRLSLITGSIALIFPFVPLTMLCMVYSF